MSAPRVVIVGGGITGLTAAWFLRQGSPDLDVVVLDGSKVPGGKLRCVELAGVPVDVGAESFLARRPEASDMVDALGLSERLTHPATSAASIWSRGTLHPIPVGTLMGVPPNPAAALGLLNAAEVAWAEGERNRPMAPVLEDLSVGDFISARVGPAVVDRLVEPLLGGVYAGHAHRLSLQAGIPGLWAAARAGEPVTSAAERASSLASLDRTPVFAGLVGGVGTLAEVLVKSLTVQRVQIESGTVVRALDRAAVRGRSAWVLVAGSVPAPVAHHADAIVMAVPAAPAARLLAPHLPAAARQLGTIAYASVAVVSLALPRSGLPQLSGSGFLVPPVEGRAVKASTFSTNKWRWVADLAPDLVILRASLGRVGEEVLLQRSDGDLVKLVLADLAEALGRALPPPVESHVQRWGGALPQYAVGHVDRVAGIRAAVAHLPGMELAGAAYDGVGIPACIASGRNAAEALLTHLRGTLAEAPE
ncbi:MAG: protoporphyrinogen oxidase [Dermatophilaceae bacterium]